MFDPVAKLEGNARQAFLVALTGKLREKQAGTPEWVAIGALLRRFSDHDASLSASDIAREVQALGADERLNPEAIAAASAVVSEVYDKFAGHLQYLFNGRKITMEEIFFPAGFDAEQLAANDAEMFPFALEKQG